MIYSADYITIQKFWQRKRIQPNANNLKVVSITKLKAGVWLYLLLLIFEGALRKWLLPSFADSLLIIRDPVALWILIQAINKRLLKWNIYILITIVIAIISFCSSFFTGYGNLFVSLFGVRILLIHIPLMFTIGKILNKEDVKKMGRFILWLSLPMTILIILQFYSPQSAWINRGVGGDIEGAGFSGALGYFRPPGTFSFTNGNALFFGLVSVFNFYFWLQSKFINKWLLIASTICLLIAIPISISRTLFYQTGISVVFVFIAALQKPKLLWKMLKIFLILIAIILLLNRQSFFETASEAFSTRFESATESEGGIKGTLVNRFLGGMVEAMQQSNELPFFGYGIGMGTNVGSMLLIGKRTFLIAETEWSRIIGEMGILLGLIFILVRVSFAFSLFIKSYKALKRMNFLPWMLISFGFFLILQGQWAQPTTLGFSTFAGGLILASLRYSKKIVHIK